MNKKYKNAFSTPEVLMALLIVGVLAVMTLPNLDKAYNRNIIQTSFVDSMKTLNSALYNYSAKNACNGRLACTDLFRADSDSASLLSTSFKNTFFTGTNCWGEEISNNISGDGETTNLNGLRCFKTGSDKIFAINNFESSCTTNLSKTDGGTPLSKKLTKSCGYIYVDINGIKEPNNFGYDVFAFVITDNPQTYLYPVGGEFWIDNTHAFGNKTSGSCATDGEGRTCAGRIVADSLKIKYLK